jgi:hypothetical protein
VAAKKADLDRELDRIWIPPFTVVVDSNEGAPYQFQGLKQRTGDGGKPIVVRTVQKAMWAMGRKEHGVGLADYSIDGWEERVQVERKSLEDLWNTLSGRRAEFEKEIARLNRDCEYAAVVVEASWTAIKAGIPGRDLAPESVIGTIRAWRQRYPGVHWLPMLDRRQAEVETFWILERFWLDHQE